MSTFALHFSNQTVSWNHSGHDINAKWIFQACWEESNIDSSKKWCITHLLTKVYKLEVSFRFVMISCSGDLWVSLN